MHSTGHTILILLGWIVLAAVTLVGYAWISKKYEIRGIIVVKLLLSCLLWPLIGELKGMAGDGAGFNDMAPFLPIYAAAAGVYLAVLWVPELTGMFAAPFGSLFDGGTAQAEPKPFYSIAWAKRKQSQAHSAILEIKKQLEKFPENHEGMMLMAEIYADDLKEMNEAEAILKKIVMNPIHNRMLPFRDLEDYSKNSVSLGGKNNLCILRFPELPHEPHM